MRAQNGATASESPQVISTKFPGGSGPAQADSGDSANRLRPTVVHGCCVSQGEWSIFGSERELSPSLLHRPVDTGGGCSDGGQPSFSPLITAKYPVAEDPHERRTAGWRYVGPQTLSGLICRAQRAQDGKPRRPNSAGHQLPLSTKDDSA